MLVNTTIRHRYISLDLHYTAYASKFSHWDANLARSFPEHHRGAGTALAVRRTRCRTAPAVRRVISSWAGAHRPWSRCGGTEGRTAGCGGSTVGVRGGEKTGSEGRKPGEKAMPNTSGLWTEEGSLFLDPLFRVRAFMFRGVLGR